MCPAGRVRERLSDCEGASASASVLTQHCCSLPQRSVMSANTAPMLRILIRALLLALLLEAAQVTPHTQKHTGLFRDDRALTDTERAGVPFMNSWKYRLYQRLSEECATYILFTLYHKISSFTLMRNISGLQRIRITFIRLIKFTVSRVDL